MLSGHKESLGALWLSSEPFLGPLPLPSLQSREPSTLHIQVCILLFIVKTLAFSSSYQQPSLLQLSNAIPTIIFIATQLLV